MIGQFTIDVASAQAGLAHAQHPHRHLPLRLLVAPTSADTPWRLHGLLCDLLVPTTLVPCYGEPGGVLPMSWFDCLYLCTNSHATQVRLEECELLHPNFCRVD